MEKIKRTKIERELYSVKCKRCDKEITGISLKQLKHNYKLHKMFCKGKSK